MGGQSGEILPFLDQEQIAVVFRGEVIAVPEVPRFPPTGGDDPLRRELLQKGLSHPRPAVEGDVKYQHGFLLVRAAGTARRFCFDASLYLPAGPGARPANRKGERGKDPLTNARFVG